MARRRHRNHHRRHRNPFGIGHDAISQTLWGVAGAAGALALPGYVMPSQNNGFMGYALNVASAIATSIVAKMAGGPNAQKDALSGGLIGTGIRIAGDLIPGFPVHLSGYVTSYFAVPTASDPYGRVLSDPYAALAPPPPAAAPAKGMGRLAGRYRSRYA